MRNLRSKKAFTLIELIIVIVILGILAGIAIVGYQAVIDRANESKVEQAAQSYDRSIRALAAFDQGEPWDASYHTLMIGDLPAGFTVAYFADVADADADPAVPIADITAAPATDDVEVVEFTDDDYTARLVLTNSSSDPGNVSTRTN
jgi:prepilin-type N-terminal cleavage/methylation domain-containing protein